MYHANQQEMQFLQTYVIIEILDDHHKNLLNERSEIVSHCLNKKLENPGDQDRNL